MGTKQDKKKSGKRSDGDGSLRQRSDGLWEARYTCGTNPANGKPIRKSIYGRDKNELAARLRKITREIDTGDYSDPSKITVKEWFNTWLTDYMAAVKPLTVQQYRSMTESHIIPALGAAKLSKLTAPQLQKFYNSLAVDGMMTKKKNPETGKIEIVKKTEQRENPETGKLETVYFPLSAKTIRNIHDIINKSLNVAVSQGIIRENVSSRCTIPKVIKRDVNPLDEDMQRKFVQAVAGHYYRNLYLVYLFCGLRESEAIGLTWDCIDFRAGTLKVYRQWQRTPGEWSKFRFEPLKNNKTRIIKLSPFVLDVFKQEYRKQNPDNEQVIDFQSVKNLQTGFVFTDINGHPINPAPVYENFKKIAEQIGIPAARLHDLRHTFAVNSLAEGDSPKTVQENLGHHSAAFTLDVYGHVSERMREESALRQQAMIERMGIKNA